MACCMLAAYFISKLIKACEYLDVNIIKAQYNAFDDGPEEFRSIAAKAASVPKLTTTKLQLEGFSCAACKTSIEKAVAALDGVERVAVSLPLSRGTVIHHEDQTTVSKILSTIEDLGYGAMAGERTVQETLEVLQHTQEIGQLRLAFANAALLSSIIVGLEALHWFTMPSSMLGVLRTVIGAIAIWIQVADAKTLHRAAWQSRVLHLTMDTLVSFSLLLGIALSIFNLALFGKRGAKTYWSSVSFLTTVILGGRTLDAILRKQSTVTFAKLYQLQEQSTFVTLIRSANKESSLAGLVDTATLARGDEIKVLPGSLIPCDCYVLDGESYVDQSTMTGESKPVVKGPGEYLMAGTQNLSYELTAIVTKAQEDSALQQLISSVTAASENTGSDASLDGMISYFVATVLGLALAGFVVTLLVQSRNLDIYRAINLACERAMAILASACPCALGLATPTVVVAGLDAAQRRGSVIKGGFDTLQKLSRLTHLVLDKTGTLTTGQLSVSRVNGELCDTTKVLLCIVEQEAAQVHPVAKALFRWAFSSLSTEQRRQIVTAEVETTSNDLSDGVAMEVRLSHSMKWHSVVVGNMRFVDQQKIVTSASNAESSINDQTVVHLAVDGVFVGSITLLDTLRADAISVVSGLRTQYGLNLAMLTGDIEAEALRISGKLGIEVASSQTSPLEKRAYIQRLRESSSHACVAMMGDGLNDAPALAEADVGIALNLAAGHGKMNTAVATNSQISEVIFTSSDLSRLPELLEIARRTTRQARWNLRWAIGYNLVALLLAMGVAEPVGIKVDAARAGTMMALSSISVLAWSLWLKYQLGKVKFRP